MTSFRNILVATDTRLDDHTIIGEAALIAKNENATVKIVDLIVMGTVARSGAAGLVMGNTAERILDQVQCSVLALKPNGFVCSIKES